MIREYTCLFMVLMFLSISHILISLLIFLFIDQGVYEAFHPLDLNNSSFHLISICTILIYSLLFSFISTNFKVNRKKCFFGIYY